MQDFNKHLPFDRALLKYKLNKGFAVNNNNIFIELRNIAEKDILSRLAIIQHSFPYILLSGLYNNNFCSSLNKGEFIIKSGQNNVDRPYHNLIFDDEFLPFCNNSLDMVVNILTLHFINDLPGYLAQIRKVLRPDGLFIGVMLGGETLFELRSSFLRAENELLGGASFRVMPFVDVRTMGNLLQRAGFTLPVVDIDRIVVRYSDPIQLLYDLKPIGNIMKDRSLGLTTERLIKKTIDYYYNYFSDPDGKIRASFELLYILGWSPDPSQPKPLVPGSGKVSLAKALKN